MAGAAKAVAVVCAIVLCVLLWPVFMEEVEAEEQPTLFYAEVPVQQEPLQPQTGAEATQTSPSAGAGAIPPTATAGEAGAVPVTPIQSVCNLPDFAPDARRLNMTIFVFAWRRLTSLQRLVSSLQNAEYCGHKLPLTISIDGGASLEVEDYVRNLQWVHGEKRLVLYTQMGLSLGIRGMWLNASSPSVPDYQHVLPLEDDIEVSPLFYWWLLRASRLYDTSSAATAMAAAAAAAGGVDAGDGPAPPGLYFADGRRLMWRDRLVGISLYTPRLNEIQYPQVKWTPDLATDSPTFLLQIPCSWGGLFFGSVWKEFIAFYHERVRPPFFDFAQEAAQRGIGKDREPLGDACLRLPASRSNVWPRSWKRFMIDFMYARGLTMLYPNLARQRSFSTTYMERGGHSGKDGVVEELSSLSVRKDVDPLKTVPMVVPAELDEVVVRFDQLPRLETLPAFDIHHTRRPREVLVAQGFAFTENVRWWGARKEATQLGDAAQYAQLATVWSGVGVGVGGGSAGVGGDTGAGTGAGAGAGADAAQAAIAAEGPARGCALAQLWDEMQAAEEEVGLAPGRASPGTHAQHEAELAADAVGTRRGSSAPDDGRNYLVYQPPGGSGEWFFALRNAAGVARALGRTLVVPHLMWDGGISKPVRFSSVFSLATLRLAVSELIEIDDFLPIGLKPRRLVMLHVKDPRLLPGRTYFDAVAGWGNLSSAHMPAQQCYARDYARLYGGCGDRVLAFSNLYAAFEGFEGDAASQSWWEQMATPALMTDTAQVTEKAMKMLEVLRKETPDFTCVHITDLETAVLNARAPILAGSDAVHIALDVVSPAAQYVPAGPPKGSPTNRPPMTVCDAYDSEAQQSMGRRWVKEHMEQGMSCHVNDAIVAANLAQLPLKQPIFVLADGQRELPEQLVARARATLQAELMHIGDLADLAKVQLTEKEWPALELRICSEAGSLMINSFSPLSFVIKRRAEQRLAAAQPPPLQPSPKPLNVMWWTRLDSDACVPLFTRTARFDIQPNRFGILGQFGPERKLQLAATNVSSLIGWDGKLVPNATVELEVYVSNASHHLHIFEYTKENNMHGLQFSVGQPTEGWKPHTWLSLVVPITDSEYSYPMSTPWERMDRLELYYANPAASQLRGDYVRIRNVFLRSTRSFGRKQRNGPPRRHQKCSELEPVNRAAPASSQGGRSSISQSGSAAPDAAQPLTRPQLGGGGGGGGDGEPGNGATDAPHNASPQRGRWAQLWRRVLLGLGVPLLIVLLSFSIAPRESAHAASIVCGRIQRITKCGPGTPIGAWVSLGKRRMSRTNSPEQTSWSSTMGHGAHHRNVVG